MKKELLKVTVYKAGYEVREELWYHNATEGPTKMKQAYSSKGDYLGDPKMTRRLIKQFGITQWEPYGGSDSRVVCHGYSPEHKKWYGWSHRAICGFGIGDMQFDPEYGDEKTPFVKRGVHKIVTLEDARKAAHAFARYVS